MHKRSSSTVNDHSLFGFVHSADPLAGSKLTSPTPRERTALLHRILARVEQESASKKRVRVTSRRAVVLALGVLVIVGGAGGAFASGVLGGSSEVTAVATGIQSPALTQLLNGAKVSDGVTNLGVVAAAPNGRAGVVEGVANGTAVVALTLADSSPGFVPIASLLNGGDLTLIAGSSGSSLDKVNEIEISGIVSGKVARVEVVSQSGDTKQLDLQALPQNAKGFAVVLDATFHPQAVVAYDENGNELVRKADVFVGLNAAPQP